MSKSHVIFFDTETTGLPILKNYNSYYPPTQLANYDSSRIASIAYIKTDTQYNIIKKEIVYIKPDQWSVSEEASKINGLTDEYLKNNGIPMIEFLSNFTNDLENTKYLVAHNIKFDINVLLSEIHRLNLSSLYHNIRNMNFICTMKLFSNKYPTMSKSFTSTVTLKRAYEYITEETSTETSIETSEKFTDEKKLEYHDALSDTIMCYRIFVFLINNHKTLN